MSQDRCTFCVLQIYANNLLLICNAGCSYVGYFPRVSSKTTTKRNLSQLSAGISFKWPFSFSCFSDNAFAYRITCCTHNPICKMGLNLFPFPGNQNCLRSVRSNAKLILISPCDETPCCQWLFRQWWKNKKIKGKDKRKGRERKTCNSYFSLDHCTLKNNSTCYKNEQFFIKWGGLCVLQMGLNWLQFPGLI